MLDALRVEVDDEHPPAGGGGRRRQPERDGGLADAALLVENRAAARRAPGMVDGGLGSILAQSIPSRTARVQVECPAMSTL